MESDDRTTVMMRHIPNNYTFEMLIRTLNETLGFRARYDFVYLPMDFARNANLGYAFINCTTPANGRELLSCLQGFSQWIDSASDKVCEAVWGEPVQGLEANIERFRNSPVMHELVPLTFKPTLFQNGIPVAFPPPTKRIRAPRTRAYAEF